MSVKRHYKIVTEKGRPAHRADSIIEGDTTACGVVLRPTMKYYLTGLPAGYPRCKRCYK